MMEKEVPPDGGGTNPCCLENFYMGYKECQEEILRQIIDTEGLDPKDAFYQRMTNFLEKSSKKFLQLSTLKTASDVQDVKPDDSLTSEAQVSNFNSQSNGQMLQGMGISENNITMIKQDEHLCTLLKRTEQTSSRTSGYSSIRSQSLSEGSLSCITLQSDEGDTTEQDKSNGFSKEISPWHPKSDRSSDSVEDENERGKQKIIRYSTSSPSSEYSRYLGSENSSTNSYCEKNKIPRYQNDFGRDGRFDSTQVPLPAFVLHPLGTHYVPVTILPTHFKSVFKDDVKGSTAYHTISIPVKFCGPSVSIHTQVEQQLLCASEGQKD
ncbi:unnamed protein product [Mytilus coruscus]|uniref:Uncharacterized protein n=1 Tax=Mytilus coruscus TaxID=42192 RepID=A0A6J8AWU0_MYTCO|nr:unnamed protein product [Mytilus coruscus]